MNTTSIIVDVRDYNDERLTSARAALIRGTETLSLEYDERSSTYRAANLAAGPYTLRVEAEGLKTEEREVNLQPGHNREIVILGKEGMPFYYRNGVKVPFEPHPELVALTLKPQSTSKDDEEVDSQLRKLGFEPEKTPDEVRQDDTRLFRLSAAVDEDQRNAILRDIEKLPSVKRVGSVVSLRKRSLSYLTNQLIVRFKEGVREQRARAIAKGVDLEILRSLPYCPNTYHLRASGEPAGYRLLEVAARLTEDKDVEWAEPNLVTTVELDVINPPDFLWPGVWDRQLVNTPDAWQRLQDFGLQAFGEPRIIIAAVDQGIQSNAGIPSHPEFQGAVSDGSNKVYQLYDFRNLVAGNDNPTGDHGMGVSGVAAALAANASPVAGQSEGLAGAAPNCRIMGLIYPNDEAEILDMYMWAAGFDANSTEPGFPAPISPGADIFTTSIGFGSGAPISAAAAALFDFLTTYGRDGKGCLCFFSAGNADNDFTTYRPWAAYERTWGMAASTLANDGVTEIRAPYSGFGPVEVCAPSHDQYPIQHNPPDRYGTWSCDLIGTGNLVGHATAQSTLVGAVNAGDTSLTLASVAGFAAGDRLLIGAPGAVGSEATTITGAPNPATNEVPVSALLNDHPNGTAVVTGANDYRNNFGGTSSATPLAAGVAALLLSANPALCWTDVRRILRDTAERIDLANNDPIGQWVDTDGDGNVDYSQWYGYGRINAEQAVIAARNEPTYCYAPVFASNHWLACLILTIIYSILIAVLVIPAIFIPSLRCTIKQLAFRINRCAKGNTDNCRRL